MKKRVTSDAITHSSFNAALSHLADERGMCGLQMPSGLKAAVMLIFTAAHLLARGTSQVNPFLKVPPFDPLYLLTSL